jgi:hypothetical protein
VTEFARLSNDRKSVVCGLGRCVGPIANVAELGDHHRRYVLFGWEWKPREADGVWESSQHDGWRVKAGREPMWRSAQQRPDQAGVPRLVIGRAPKQLPTYARCTRCEFKRTLDPLALDVSTRPTKDSMLREFAGEGLLLLSSHPGPS